MSNTKNYPPNRFYLLNSNSKLFCAECSKSDDPQLRQVTDFFKSVDLAVLDCGHRRSMEAQQ